jgi:hypothetical protein
MIARRFLVYGLISLGTFFALVAAYIYRNDGVPNEKAFVTIAIPALLSGAAFVESGLLLWSNQPSRIRSDDRTLDAEVEQAHLRKIFYQLVTDRQGAFTLIQFAIAAGTSPEVAQDFLKHHATTFNANFTVTEEGSVVYQFPMS